MARVAVVPAGAWGTALAAVAAWNGNDTWVYSRRQDVVDAINRGRENPKHLPGIRLPRGITASSDLTEVVQGAQLIIFTPSSSGFRQLAADMAGLVSPGTLLVSGTKGLEPGSGLRMSEVLVEELPSAGAQDVMALSGPNFASEVARRLPAGTVVAGGRPGAAPTVQSLLGSSRFRIYTNPDLIGVEVAGALKNVLALGTGIVHGASLGYNAEAALITRGLLEMSRLGLICGASPWTFAGLAGMGDVVVTCTGSLSRNRRAGIMLGQGHRLEDVLARMTVEGVRTTLAAHEMAARHGIEMPITAEIHSIITAGKNPYRAALSLMKREQKDELDPAVIRQMADFEANSREEQP